MDTSPIGSTLTTDTITPEFFQNYELPQIEDCPGKIRKNFNKISRNAPPYVKVFIHFIRKKEKIDIDAFLHLVSNVFVTSL